jgi:hypothetical protein
MSLTSEEIIREAGTRFMTTGDTFRLHHQECPERTKSSGTDPEMVVTRSNDGFVWFCHRCKQHDKIYDRGLTPSQTSERIKAMQRVPVGDFKANEKPALPSDFIPIRHGLVPDKAQKWIWSAGIPMARAEDCGFGWSKAYQRVIIPVVSGGELKGWVGREVEYEDKKERDAAGVAKYITRKGSDRDRIYFIAGEEALRNNMVILVEDALSAIKIFEATGITAMALLTTSVDDNLLRWLRHRETWLWLDGNMLAHSVKLVARMRSLGIKAHHISTPRDPKEHSAEEIRDELNWREQTDEESGVEFKD